MKHTRPLILFALLALVALVFYKYRQPRFVAGEKAPDFEVGLLTGERAKLSDLEGNMCCSNFGEAGAGPCRKENPELVAIYQKYHDRGFEIFSVALEPNPRAWQAAIAQDGLIWKYHTMESSEFVGGRAQQFNVKSIPTSFLLNAEGVIMGVNLKPEYIDKMLGEKI